MNEGGANISYVLCLIGVIIVLATAFRQSLRKTFIPPLVIFILIGVGVNLVDSGSDFLSAGGEDIFRFLARLGLIALLFRIGLESKISELLGQLKRASYVWFGNVAVSSALGFLACYHLLGSGIIPSVFVAVAMAATSVGVSLAPWEEAGALESPDGQLLLDVAEMDDMSSVVLMSALFVAVPVLKHQDGSFPTGALAVATGLVGLKLAGFGIAYVLFYVFGVDLIMRMFKKIAGYPGLMILITGVGVIISAVSLILGFSVAIGAFLAGLAFSKLSDAEKVEETFDGFYEMFSPFFFVGIGMSVQPDSLSGIFLPVLILFTAGVVGKIAGTGLPVLPSAGWKTAFLLGIGMVPRAEIAMVVMHRGLSLGEWAVPSRLFSAMVITAALTCVIFPVITHDLLEIWPRGAES